MPNELHQSDNSFINEFSSAIHTENDYSKHFHRNYEILIVISGICKCEINNRSYTLSKGQAIFICPLMPHNFELSENSVIRRVNFNDAIILTFDRALNGRLPIDPVFKLNESTFEYVIKMLDELFGSDSGAIARITPHQKRMRVKGLLYLLCGELGLHTDLTEKPKFDALAIEITEYIANNFTKDISLKDVAREKGYNYQYLSRIFNRTLNTNFKKMLNLYRLQQAYTLLLDTDLPISRIAFDSGFQSIRAFNQVCQDVYKKTPKQLRNVRKIEHI
ncbi:MAG: AraC family transcriptional regulator [Ruminococcaceae bacterium]|nr:AraC family transcriptional regulator [Oscillospiraceae bacterium]